MIVVITHRSTLVLYILARVLLEKFTSLRSLRIIIIQPSDDFSSRGLSHEVRPWCGTTTINSTTLYDGFIARGYIPKLIETQGLKIKLMRQAGTVHDVENASTDRLDVSLMLLEEDPANSVGFLYNPAMLLHILREKLLHSGRVTFLSQLGRLDDIIGNFQLEDVALFSFDPNIHPAHLLTFQHNLVINSNCSEIRYHGPTRFPQHVLPHNVLWIPKIRAFTGSTDQAQFHHKSQMYHNVKEFYIYTTNYHFFRDNVLIDLDVYLALGIASYVLRIFESIRPVGSRL